MGSMRFTIGVIILVAIVIAGGYLWWQNDKDNSIDNKEGRDVATGGMLTEAEVVEEIQGGTVDASSIDAGKSVYRNAEYGFSFTYPNELSISSVADFGGDVILVRNQESNEEFQIYVSAFDEPGPITPERILQDLPELTIESPQQVMIGGGSVQALIFNGVSEDFGRTREVWFVGGGHLFQVITHEGMDTFVGPILDTWQFGS